MHLPCRLSYTCPAYLLSFDKQSMHAENLREVAEGVAEKAVQREEHVLPPGMQKGTLVLAVAVLPMAVCQALLLQLTMVVHLLPMVGLASSQVLLSNDTDLLHQAMHLQVLYCSFKPFANARSSDMSADFMSAAGRCC